MAAPRHMLRAVSSAPWLRAARAPARSSLVAVAVRGLATLERARAALRPLAAAHRPSVAAVRSSTEMSVLLLSRTAAAAAVAAATSGVRAVAVAGPWLHLAPPLAGSRSPLVAPRWGAQLLVQRRTFAVDSGSVGRERLLRLKAEADAEPADTDAVLAYYEALVLSGRSHLVVEFSRAAKYAEDERVARVVDMALQDVGSIRQSYGFGDSDLRSGMDRSSSMPPQASPAAGGVGTTENPLRVSVVTGRFDGWMGHLVRLGLFLMIVTVVLPLVQQMGGESPAAGGSSNRLSRMLGVGALDVVPERGVDVRFSDVKGCNEAIDEIRELVEFLKNPEKFSRLGGELPKGVLLLGPPGTGKTLLARAVAGEAGVPFFSMSGSAFDEVFVGLGSRRVRELFAAARKAAPCLVFIDEIDAVGGKRSMRDAGSQGNRQTINELLQQMDGFHPNEGVILIGATNFAESLDPALLRPGRFDKQVVVPVPDIKGREEIFQLYLKRVRAAADVSANVMARATPGSTGAQIRNMVNIAAIRAATENKAQVEMADLEFAKDRVLMGAERKSAVMRPEERRTTAYHEGGHALVALNTRHAMPIHKATIMPRGQALGMVQQLPEHDVVSYSKAQLLAMLDVCMGGRVAEELTFGPDAVTTGASNDLEKATQIASSMVRKYGMGDTVGLRSLEADERLSPEASRLVDEEVKRLLDNSYARVKDLLTAKRRDLDAVATALLERETLSLKDIQAVLRALPSTDE